MQSFLRGFQKNSREAVEWFSKAAEQGNTDAQTMLGSMYTSGEGVEKDLQKSYFWTLLSSTSGDQRGIQLRDLVGQSLTASQRAKAEADAAVWKPK